MEIWNRRNPVGGAPIVDSALDVNSEHCVQNKVVAEQFSAINSKLPTCDELHTVTGGTVGATDISLDLSKYNFVVVQYISDTNSGISNFAICKVGYASSLNSVQYSGGNIYQRNRNFSVTANGIHFDNGTQNGADNSYINLPRKIFGVR